MVASEADLRTELVSLRGGRDHLVDDLETCDSRLGEVARQLVEEHGVSRSQVGRLAGVSHTHVTTLIERSRARAQRDPHWLAPVLSGWQALKYVAARSRTVTRIVAGFAETDVLLASGVHPRAFEQEAGSPLHVPCMLWQLDDQSWLGIEGVAVGYPGTGPRYALQALEDLGLSPKLAHQIAYHRFSDTDVLTGQFQGSDVWPVYPPGQFSAAGQAYVTELEAHAAVRRSYGMDTPGDGVAVDVDGHLLHGPQVELQSWVDFLDRTDCPEWMRGERVARVFLDPDAARAQGFTSAPFARREIYSLIIEQGELQLWVPVFLSRDPLRSLSEEMYQALKTAGLYPGELAQRDARSAFRRYLDTHLRPQQHIPYVDVSSSGTGRLRSTPAHREQAPTATGPAEREDRAAR